MTAEPHATFTLRGVQEKLGLSRTVLAGLIAAGFVTPRRGARNALRFTFQDLLLLRTAHALQRAGIPPRRILDSLARLKSALPAELPLTGLRITAVGADVAVRERSGTLASMSGQLLMDFEVARAGSGVAFLEPGGRASGAATSADPSALLGRAEALESAGDDPGAEAAYREALALAPDCVAAYLNLGTMLGEAGRGDAALALYEAAVRHCPDSAAVWFNRAVALEDRQRLAQATASYEHALALDPTLADAHFNLGRLHEQSGDPRAALRHFNAYRRLRS